ncbi:SprT family zinc-dependent metalloprotease [Paenibacillus filicis]|uniref:SprT family zinc-dependent metalloprotease n=1 Tax=Paenibacillus gyeongsangnamensis TaxID=3388067 RepID=A0ABT4QL14_9BACL|nr:SprT family zinc-dependent metalloprotease [Paenibacillus filicis]MCZ8517562.1 SprT family zinc-dependent metalloprotease [Paenibacillus filicis]
MDFTYIIQRSAKRRKLTITVERDRSIVVHAPEGTSDEKIQQVVESKRQWIYEKIGHPQKYQELPHAPGKETVSGESALYLGRQYRIEVIKTDANEIQFSQRFLIPAKLAKQAEALREWYIGKAKEKIVPRVMHHAHQLGVDVAMVKIVDNRYRWGSCTVNDNVNFNWRLIKAPMFVIDYVIVHELAHLIESNHTPRFWNIVRAQTPKMEKAKAWLKENGQLLEEVI